MGHGWRILTARTHLLYLFIFHKVRFIFVLNIWKMKRRKWLEWIDDQVQAPLSIFAAQKFFEMVPKKALRFLFCTIISSRLYNITELTQCSKFQVSLGSLTKRISFCVRKHVGEERQRKRLEAACLFPFSVERASFHLSSYTGICRHAKGGWRSFISRRFTENYERRCSTDQKFKWPER